MWLYDGGGTSDSVKSLAPDSNSARRPTLLVLVGILQRFAVALEIAKVSVCIQVLRQVRACITLAH